MPSMLSSAVARWNKRTASTAALEELAKKRRADKLAKLAKGTMSLTWFDSFQVKKHPNPMPSLPSLSSNSKTASLVRTDSSHAGPKPKTPPHLSIYKPKASIDLCMPPLPTVDTLEECLANFTSKSQIHDLQEMCATSKNGRLQVVAANLAIMEQTLRPFLVDVFEKVRHQELGLWKFKLSPVVGGRPTPTNGGQGIYVFQDDPAFGPVQFCKVGMSFHVPNRIKILTEKDSGGSGRPKTAFMLMSLQECRDVVPKDLLSLLQECSIYKYHDGHTQKKDDLFVMQVVELALACCYKTSTQTVLERVLAVPSETILDELDPSMDFVKEQEAMNRFDKFFQGGWSNAVKTPPRCKKLEVVKDDLTRVIDGIHDAHTTVGPNKPIVLTECQKEQICGVLDQIKYENKGHYEQPTGAELAAGAKQELIQKLTMDPTEAIYLERCSLEALLKNEQEWAKTDFLNMSSELDLVEGDKWALALFFSKRGHLVIVTNSYFIAFAENVGRQTRHKSVRGYMAMQSILRKVGYQSDGHFEYHRSLMQRFLIDLDFGHDDNAEQDMYGNMEDGDGDDNDDDDDTRDHNNTPFATHRNRIYVMPKGYFRGAPPNSLVVSKRLDIGYAEMFWLRAFLDWMYWSYLLQAHDIDPNSPFEPGRKCGGVPAAGKQPAQPCRHNHLSQGQCFVCVGAMDPENAFKNLIL